MVYRALATEQRARRIRAVVAAVVTVVAVGCGGGSKLSAPTAPSTSTTGSGPPPGVSAYPAIDSCEMSYTSPGAYTLPADFLSASATPTPCIGLRTSGITLDCAQHVITGFVIVAPATANVTIRNCVATGIAPVVDSSNLMIESSRLATSLYLDGASDTTVRNNQISAKPGATAVVAFSNGHDNRVVENSLDGGGARGADDGIVLANETNDTISDNTISNVFDAGVEGIDALTDTVIVNNTITHAVTAGIGSYWCTAWQHVTIEGNRFAEVRAGIRIEYSKDGRCAGWGAEPAADFSGNVIADNTLDLPVPATAPAITVKLDDYAATVVGNILRNNDFGASPIDVHPLAGFQDGGGNTCGSDGTFKC
jgi:parallel beta-helix repeat protein